MSRHSLKTALSSKEASEAMRIEPIVRTTTAQVVAKRLVDMIGAGTFASGDQLPPEKELMQRLQVGRSTIREALQILATLNLVRAAPGQGTFVRELTADNLLRGDMIGVLLSNSVALELLEAREMIEPSLIRLACLRGTEQDFERIERLLDDHEAAWRREEPVSDYAARFHVLIAEAAHNRVGVTFMTSILELLMRRGRSMDGRPDFHAHEIAEHRELMRLIRERDGERASEALLRHIVESAATYDRDNVIDGRPLLQGSAAQQGPARGVSR